MDDLETIRGYLREHGFRWDAYLNGNCVSVFVDGFTFNCFSLQQAKDVITYAEGGKYPAFASR